MPGKSRFVRPVRTLGSALILGVVAFLWAASFSNADWTGLGAFVGFAALLSFLAGSSRPQARVALFTIAALTMILALLTVMGRLALGPTLGAHVVILFLFTVAAIVWHRDQNGYARRQRILLAFIAASLPPIFARRLLLRELGGGGLALLGLLLVLGSSMHLWGRSALSEDSEDSEGEGETATTLERTLPTWVAFILGAAALGLFVFVSAPLVLAGFSFILRLSLQAIAWLLFQLLRPTGTLMDKLIAWFRSLAQSGEDRPLYQWGRAEWEERPVEEYVTPRFWTIVGYLILAAVCLVILRFIWIALRKRSDEPNVSASEQVQSNWSNRRAVDWIIDAGKDLLASAADFARGLMRTKSRPADPLLAVYVDFLAAAKEAFRERQSYETPMEYGASLADALPTVSTSAMAVSTDFCKFFYGGKAASAADIESIRNRIALMKQLLSSPPPEKS